MKKYHFKPRFYIPRIWPSPSYLPKVFKRDRGICANCGLDTIAFREALAYVYARCDKGDRWTWWPLTFEEFRHAVGKAAHWFPRHKNLWEVDHIIPLDNYGNDAMKNLQTLCHACHSEKTSREKHGSYKRRHYLFRRKDS